MGGKKGSSISPAPARFSHTFVRSLHITILQAGDRLTHRSLRILKGVLPRMECYFIEVLQHVDDNDFKRILRQEPLGAYELSTHPTHVKTKRKVIMKQPDYRE